MVVASLMSVGAALILTSVRWFVDRRAYEQLSRLERLWVFSTITWFVTYKVVLAQAFFSSISGNSTTGTLIGVLPGIFVGVLLFGQRLSRGAPPSPAGILALTLPLIGCVYILNGTGLSAALAVLVLLPASLTSHDRANLAVWGREVRGALLAISVVTSIAIVVRPTSFLQSCRVDKCTISGLLFSTGTGVDGQSLDGNFLGVAVLVLVPWALCGARLRVGLAVCLAAGALIELSGSRSSLAAVAVLIVVVILTRSLQAGWSSAAVTALLQLSIIVSAWTALHTYKDQDFTYRGILWRSARKIISESPILGRGPGYWSSQHSATGFAANYSPHNVWLELAVAGGVVAVLTVVVIGVVTTVSLSGKDRLHLVTVWSTILLIGTLEAPFQPYRTGLAPFILPLILLASDRASGARESGDVRRSAAPSVGQLHPSSSTRRLERLR